MINSLLKTIKREFNIMARGKMIFIVIFIIPLLTNLLLGYQFSKDIINKVPMAVYDGDNSSLSRMIIEQFSENEMFDIEYYLEDSNDMKKLIDDSKIRVGMIIPKDFSKNVMGAESPSILMVYDGSHMPIAAATKKSASEILLSLKTGVFMKLIKAKLDLPADVAEKIALSIKFSSRTLYNPAGSYKNFLNIGLGTAIVQSAIAIMTASAIRRSEIEKKKRKKSGYILGKVLFYGILGCLSLILNIYVQCKLFKVPLRGKFFDATILSLVLAFAVSAFGLMISSWIKDHMLSTLINAVIFIPNTIMIGYTWPVLSMPRPYQVAANFYPFYHFADNLRDLCLKGLSITKMNGDIMWFVKFTLITLVIALLGVLIIKAPEHSKKISPSEEGTENVIS